MPRFQTVFCANRRTCHIVVVCAWAWLTASSAHAQRIPEIVTSGRQPQVRACGDCHATDGVGRPGAASLAGLSAEYIADQIESYRKGLRGRSGSTDDPSTMMQTVARAMDRGDVREAASYFSALDLRPWMRVVEADTVVNDGRADAIGQRIVETPDPRGRGFVAYVPPGVLRKGETLVTTGSSGRTMRCAQCHGPELRGVGRVPPIAGRSPTYLVRQLSDMRIGVRHGAGPDLMMAAVARLSDDDLIAIAAYIASRAP